MDSDGFGQDCREIEVELPPELLEDIDDYATTHGFRTPSAVVRHALESF